MSRRERFNEWKDQYAWSILYILSALAGIGGMIAIFMEHGS